MTNPTSKKRSLVPTVADYEMAREAFTDHFNHPPITDIEDQWTHGYALALTHSRADYADETRARQRYSVTGRFIPLSENGVPQNGLTIIHETTHDVYICDDSSEETSARFCRSCGGELVDGNCPKCSGKATEQCQHDLQVPGNTIVLTDNNTRAVCVYCAQEWAKPCFERER